MDNLDCGILQQAKTKQQETEESEMKKLVSTVHNDNNDKMSKVMMMMVDLIIQLTIKERLTKLLLLWTITIIHFKIDCVN